MRLILFPYGDGVGVEGEDVAEKELVDKLEIGSRGVDVGL